jgi:hypothetical protein
MMAPTGTSAKVERITPQLVRAFAFMLQHPTHWIAAAELVAASGTTKMTVYSRFANLTAAAVLRSRQIGDFRHWRVGPDWQSVPLGRELHRRAVDAGLIPAPAAES